MKIKIITISLKINTGRWNSLDRQGSRCKRRKYLIYTLAVLRSYSIVGKACGVNTDVKSGAGVSKNIWCFFFSTSFWQLLRHDRCHAVLGSLGQHRWHGNGRRVAWANFDVPAQAYALDRALQSQLTATTNHGKQLSTYERIPNVLLYGETFIRI